ncbi:GNAT family N-acetyltransferase [Vagococcus fluvialis]|uniref:GNAT family N-acetyltransferase n=1 Tax=Vagococcus fluvialis TaxID=2738 RepID=UPI001A8D3F7B|nr:GNAT family N-acetyltransferase [Vagococcus fluvialis]MBO0428325.1 GNAT family N-acetyltransferase [Vagococcus fluvialis]
MFIKNYEDNYLDEVVLMIKECIIDINKKDYSEKQILAWSDINLNDFKQSVPKNAKVVLTNENEIVGYGDMNDTGYLDRLFVHNKYQNQGIATLLVKELEENCSSLSFSTYSSITAKTFFKSQGYKVIKENKAFLRGEVFLNYYMKKIISDLV